MHVAILAFIFGVLLFFMSAAGVALEHSAASSGIAGLAFLALALLHAGSGFLALGGASAYTQARHGSVALYLATSAVSTVIAGLAAIRLAAHYGIAMSQHTAIFVVVATLAIGAASAALTLRWTGGQIVES